MTEWCVSSPARRRLAAVCAATLLASVFIGCGGGPATTMRFTYQAEGLELPSEVRTYAIVFNEDQGDTVAPPFQYAGNTETFREYQPDYSKEAASRLAQALDDAARRSGSRGRFEQVLRSDDLKRLLDERDLQLADVVKPGAASEYRELLGCDMFFVIDCRPRVVERTWQEQKADLLAAAQGRTRTRYINASSRQITLEGSIRIDEASGTVRTTHPISVNTMEKEDGNLFSGTVGGGGNLADLQVVWDKILPEVDSASEIFASELFGGERTFTSRIEGSGCKHCQEGVKLLSRKKYAQAEEAFNLSIEEDSRGKDHTARFGLGLIAEVNHDFGAAREFYQEALDIAREEGDDDGDEDSPGTQYRQALERVEGLRDGRWRVPV